MTKKNERYKLYGRKSTYHHCPALIHFFTPTTERFVERARWRFTSRCGASASRVSESSLEYSSHSLGPSSYGSTATHHPESAPIFLLFKLPNPTHSFSFPPVLAFSGRFYIFKTRRRTFSNVTAPLCLCLARAQLSTTTTSSPTRPSGSELLKSSPLSRLQPRSSGRDISFHLATWHQHRLAQRGRMPSLRESPP